MAGRSVAPRVRRGLHCFSIRTFKSLTSVTVKSSNCFPTRRANSNSHNRCEKRRHLGVAGIGEAPFACIAVRRRAAPMSSEKCWYFCWYFMIAQRNNQILSTCYLNGYGTSLVASLGRPALGPNTPQRLQRSNSTLYAPLGICCKRHIFQLGLRGISGTARDRDGLAFLAAGTEFGPIVHKRNAFLK
jgi:hypothetical protein